MADAKRHKATFDRDDPRVSGKGRGKSAKDSFDQALEQPPGTPPVQD
jgi:hypothetical protein